MTQPLRAVPVDILTEIKRRLEALPTIQQQIASYILEHPQDVVRMSISHLAMETGAKREASIVKFYRSLGFSGYHDFKVTLATQIAGNSFHKPDMGTEIEVHDDVLNGENSHPLLDIHETRSGSRVRLWRSGVQCIHKSEQICVIVNTRGGPVHPCPAVFLAFLGAAGGSEVLQTRHRVRNQTAAVTELERTLNLEELARPVFPPHRPAQTARRGD
jgi:hypothetical protein